MALKAGYYGIKRRTKNLLLNLINSLPPGISPENPVASKSDVLTAVDLLDDTVGWTGKNKFPNKTNTVGANTYTVDGDGYVSTNVDSDGRTWSYANSNIKFTLKKGTYKVRGYEKTASTSGYTGFHILDDSNNELLAVSSWNNFMTDALTLTLAQDTNIGVEYKLGNGEYAFMIAEEEQYKLSPAYEPYHESVAEMLTPIVYNTYKAINSGIVSESVSVRAVRNIGGIQIHVDFTVGENDISPWNNLIQFEPALKNGVSMRDTVEAIRDVTDEILSAIKLVTITQENWIASNNTFKAGHRYQFNFTYLV